MLFVAVTVLIEGALITVDFLEIIIVGFQEVKESRHINIKAKGNGNA